MKTQSIQRLQAGLTLVELLIAMLLSLLVMAGLLALFTGTKQTFSIQQAASQVQTDGNAALALISEQVRLAGYPKGSLTAEGIKDNPESGDTLVTVELEAPYAGYVACSGEGLGGTPLAEGDSVEVLIDILDSDGDGVADELVCRDPTNTANTAVLADLASNLTLSYGEVGTGTLSIDYGDFDDIGDRRNVMALRLSFTLTAENDPAIQRTFAATIPMRNQGL